MATAKKPIKATGAKTTKSASTPKKKTTRVTHAATTRKKKTARIARNAFVMPSEYNDAPFLTFRITHQTLYWGILCVVVLALGLWVVDINDKVMRIYDQIDEVNTATEKLSVAHHGQAINSQIDH